MMVRSLIVSCVIGAVLAASPSPSGAAPDSIVSVSRSGSASAVSIVLSVDGRRSLVEGCTGGGCGECTDDSCSWGVPAGREATLTVSSGQGFVASIDAECLGGIEHSEVAPGIAKAACIFRTKSGPMRIAISVNRPKIVLNVEGPTTALVIDPNQAIQPIVLTVATGSGTVEVDRGAIVSFRQSPSPNAPSRVDLKGFRGDCVSDEPWCNVAIDKPLVSVTASAALRPLLP